MKDLYALIQESLSGSNKQSILEELDQIESSLEEEEDIPLPKIDSEIDVLQPKLGNNQLEEYIIRKRLLDLARSKNSRLRKEAREILFRIYNLKLYP